MKRWIKKIIVRIREGYLKEIYKETVWMYQYVKRYWFSIQQFLDELKNDKVCGVRQVENIK